MEYKSLCHTESGQKSTPGPWTATPTVQHARTMRHVGNWGNYTHTEATLPVKFISAGSGELLFFLNPADAWV